jgi:hypothetical protein
MRSPPYLSIIPWNAGWQSRNQTEQGILPQTDALLARAINIGIGVSDPGSGSAFGVTIRDEFDGVDARAAQFRQVALKYS